MGVGVMSSEYTRHYDDLGAGEEWGTPPGIVTPLADALGGFDLDPASGAEPTPYADETLTIVDDGLTTPWHGDVWLNPPYGRKHNPEWADKVVHEAARDGVDTITVLAPAATGTAWFGDTYAQADAITLIHKRVKFVDAADVSDTLTGATFGSVIASFGDFPDEYFDAFDDLHIEGEGDYPATTYRRR